MFRGRRKSRRGVLQGARLTGVLCPVPFCSFPQFRKQTLLDACACLEVDVSGIFSASGGICGSRSLAFSSVSLLTTELIFAKCSGLSTPPVLLERCKQGIIQAEPGTWGMGVLCLAGHTKGRGEDPEPDTPECSAHVPSFPSHVSGRADQRDAASEQDLGAQSVRAAENTPGNHRAMLALGGTSGDHPCSGRVTQSR